MPDGECLACGHESLDFRHLQPQGGRGVPRVIQRLAIDVPAGLRPSGEGRFRPAEPGR